MVGDVSFLKFEAIVPQVICDIDFEKSEFSFFESKQVAKSLELIDSKDNSRLHELWCYYNDTGIIERHSLSLLEVLGSMITKVMEKSQEVAGKNRLQLVKHIQAIKDSIKTSVDEISFTDAFEKQGITTEMRGRAISLIDSL